MRETPLRGNIELQWITHLNYQFKFFWLKWLLHIRATSIYIDQVVYIYGTIHVVQSWYYFLHNIQPKSSLQGRSLEIKNKSINHVSLGRASFPSPSIPCLGLSLSHRCSSSPSSDARCHCPCPKICHPYLHMDARAPRSMSQGTLRPYS